VSHGSAFFLRNLEAVPVCPETIGKGMEDVVCIRGHFAVKD
jgi:hypothetical protein